MDIKHHFTLSSVNRIHRHKQKEICMSVYHDTFQRDLLQMNDKNLSCVGFRKL